MMTCQDAVALLSDPAARQADTELRAHLDGCAGCRAAFRDIQALEQTAALPPAEKLERFAARVKAAHVAGRDRTLKAAPLRGGLIAGALGAAGVAVVVLALQSVFPTGHVTVSDLPELAAGTAPSAAPPSSVDRNAARSIDEELFGAAASDTLVAEILFGTDLSGFDDELYEDDFG